MVDLMFERLKTKAEYAKKLLNMPQGSISQEEHTMLMRWIQEYESHQQFAAGDQGLSKEK